MCKILITERALETIFIKEIYKALVRFENRDWGLVTEEERYNNTVGLLIKRQIVGIYRTNNGTKFYIELEAGHKKTIIKLAIE